MSEIDVRKQLDDQMIVSVTGRIPLGITGITQDSRLVEPGNIFVARSGSQVRGGDYITQAAERGASLIVTQDSLPENVRLPVICVRDVRYAMQILSKAVYNDPSSRLKLLCITGTNGKTSSVYFMKSILTHAGEGCGFLSTIEYDTGARKLDASLTTPDMDRINELLSEMVDNGCGWAMMEASSHALHQGRLDGLRIEVGAFTNLSQDHLDYHDSMEDYAQAKSELFKNIAPSGFAVVNIRDKWGRMMIEAAECRVITYSSDERECDLRIRTVEHSIDGGKYRLEWKNNQIDVSTALIGEYQGENIALAAGIAIGSGIDLDVIKSGIEGLEAVPGRMQAVKVGQPFALLVDYSHTPDALENALRSLKSLCRGRLIVAFGCGGDRDRSKRSEMGRIAGELADEVIVTSDNPRTEDPQQIADDIAAGLRNAKTKVELDRRLAIREAIKGAGKGDVVLIAGKGHENYQIVGKTRREFDDCIVAVEELSEAGWK